MIDLKAARARSATRPGPRSARKGAAEAFDRLLEADERWRALVPRIDELAVAHEAEGQADARAARGAAGA